MLCYPYIAHNFLDSSEQVGLFLGLAIHDTAQVVGSAMTYNELFQDELAMRIAVVTKLTRNIFLAGVIPYLAYSTVGGGGQGGAAAGAAGGSKPALTWAGFKQHLPLFVVGFLGMACARSVGDWSLASTGAAYGVVPPEMWSEMTSGISKVGSHYLIGSAMAAVGLSTSFATLKGVGMKPFALGIGGAFTVGATAYGCASVLPYVMDVTALPT